MATKLELNHLDHKIYSAIKQIRGQKNRADINSIHKEIVKVIDFEAISKEFLNDRIEMLLQNDKIINRLNRNKNSYRLNESLLDSSMTDLLPSTQKSPSNSDTPQITRTPNQTSITDFSHIPKVNIENIPGELTLAKFRNLILTELGNDIKVIVENEIKEHFKNETPKSDNFYLKEINSLKEELNKKEVFIKDLVETIKNLTTNSLKQQQPIQSQSFTSDSDENNYILTARPVNYKEINLDNTNMNTSTMNDDLRDKSMDNIPKKRNDNSILEQLEELKKREKMTTMLSSSVRTIKQVGRFVKL